MIRNTQNKLEETGNENQKSWNILKHLVSKKKKRYVNQGFDLDLSYVTPRVIAMGFPSVGMEAFYRNNMEDVQNFFNLKYPGFYKIYNLCSERKY